MENETSTLIPDRLSFQHSSLKAFKRTKKRRLKDFTLLALKIMKVSFVIQLNNSLYFQLCITRESGKDQSFRDGGEGKCG